MLIKRRGVGALRGFLCAVLIDGHVILHGKVLPAWLKRAAHTLSPLNNFAAAVIHRARELANGRRNAR